MGWENRQGKADEGGKQKLRVESRKGDKGGMQGKGGRPGYARIQTKKAGSGARPANERKMTGIFLTYVVHIENQTALEGLLSFIFRQISQI